MDRAPRALNIPTGRVSQRIQAFQDDTANPPTPPRTITKPAASLKHSSPTSTRTEVGSADVPEVPATEHVKSSPDHHEFMVRTDTKDSDERGRSTFRSAEADALPQSLEDADEVLEDVRARLYSVQKIVRRERSGSSQARDDMMDELGSMLDNAIATTMTPLRTPHPLTRTSSVKKPSPIKQDTTAQLGRSQSLKLSSPRKHDRVATFSTLSSQPTSLSSSSPKPLPLKPHSPSPRSLLVQGFADTRERLMSEPAPFVLRRTGFPLSSPVRERALLWESMSQAQIPEIEHTSSPFTTKFHPVPPPPPSMEDRPTSATPPIPLALPQFVEAERKQEQEKLIDQTTELPKTEEVKRTLGLQPTPTHESPEWPGQLQFTDRGPSNPTTRQSTSFAEAAPYDEHHAKPRPSVVKTTIRDLLQATKRKVSAKGKSVEHTKQMSGEPPVVNESEIKQSARDLSSTNSKDIELHLPHLQATSDEVKEIISADGADSTKRSSLISAYESTHTQKYESPQKKPSASPIKPNPSTPVRGRTRGTQSPGGRPFSIDHKFNLSPSRSQSQGSRGSLTFNIKARVSPGRGLGKDDTELFVTANIESDSDDEI